MDSETKLKNLKRKLLEKRNKVEAMLFELQELNQKILTLKPDNSEIVRLLKSLGNKIEALEMKPEIKVESKEVKPIINSPEVNVEVNQENVIKEIKLLREKINSKPALQTNKLISDLINKIEALELKPEIKVESKEVKVQPPVFDPHIEVKSPKIEVKPADIHIEKTDVKTPIDNLSKSLKKIFPKDEMPESVEMALNQKDLWRNVVINYPSGKVKINIDRNFNDVIQGITFSKE